jgi:hypothetical protein
MALIGCWVAGISSAQEKVGVCEEVIATLRTDIAYRAAPSMSPRVEVRLCDAGHGETMQLIAWEENSRVPVLRMDTGDFGIIQMIARGNIFVIETGGPTRDQVYVIVYDRGKPKIAYTRATRAIAEIQLTSEAVELNVPGIYAGDLPAKTEKRTFLIDAAGTHATGNARR